MSDTQEHILVIKLSALGDFILALGAMEAIRKHHPAAHITLLTTPPFFDMAVRSGYFDSVSAFKRPKWFEYLSWVSLFRFFNNGNFTRVYDLQFNKRTKRYYNLFLKKPEWSGVIKGSPLYYPNPNWRQMHSFERHKEVLEVAGIEMKLPDISWMTSSIDHLNIRKPYVLFIPGSAPQHPYKRWPAIRYGAMAMKLVRDGYNVIALGTKAEQDTIDTICKACPEVIDLCGQTTFYDIYTLARESCGVVGNDTGPTHVAALSNVPTTVLFTTQATTPELSAPVGKEVKSIVADDIKDISVGDVYSNFTPINPLPLTRHEGY